MAVARLLDLELAQPPFHSVAMHIGLQVLVTAPLCSCGEDCTAIQYQVVWFMVHWGPVT